MTRQAGKLFVWTLCLLAAGVAFVPAQAQPRTWRHGIVEAKSDAGFVMMASRGGFAEKQGLTIEMVQFKGDALALKALLAGELDSYEGSPGGPMIAASRGADVRIIGCYWPALTYGIFAKPAIATPQDLKGKSFAISAPGALPDLLARVVLETNNIPASEVRFAMLGSDADRYRALAAGTVDVATASTEFVPLAAKSGLRLFVHGHDVAPNYLRFCTYVGGKTLAARGDDAARFLAAQMAGLRHALANRDEEIRLTKEITGEKPDDARAAYIFDEVVRLSAIDPQMAIPRDKLAWMQDLLVRTGNLTKPVDLAGMVNDGVRRKALEMLGK
ncbi:MAG TPA: ABC transporter substrate-binding protein [Xanthobacteraceae bacterium]|nr:ABC transporter substrate-binding protein [Xanthobacteraceae bacterium]